MHIQDLQYLENVDRTDEINISGAFGSGLINIFGETGGNFTFFSGEVDVIGDNTISEVSGEGDVIQGGGSSSSVQGFGFAIPGR